MDLDQLRAFLAVLEHGSLLSAAAALKISRAALRERLDALEVELGVTLLVRTHRGALPTEAGLGFAPGARQLLRDARALAQFHRQPAEPAGDLRIRAPVGMPPEWVAGFVSELYRRFPRVHVRADFASQQHLNFPADVDIYLYIGPHIPPGAFRTFVLSRIPERLLASRAYLDRVGRPTTVEDLQAKDLLSWVPPGEDGRRWPLLSGGGVSVRPYFASDDIHLLRSMVAAGHGIGFLPDHPMAPGVRGEELEVLFPEQIGRECVGRLVIPEPLAESPRYQQVADLLRAVVRGLFGLNLDELTS